MSDAAPIAQRRSELVDDHPDVSVGCGPAELADPTPDTLANPVVIVEVLSPSTEADDRGDRFARRPDVRERLVARFGVEWATGSSRGTLDPNV